MKKSTDPMECSLATCTRRKTGSHVNLLCKAHWAMVPRRMKLALWAAMKIRSKMEHAFQTMSAAENILAYLERKKVVLPDEPRILSPESEIEKPNTEKRILLP